ncbi:T9SS type A sorting domain-containing protein [Epilithonimonas sp. JDS]|uniref:T9SS type A sorting domain-containing protein n=1 Tax=Epilithonimonas sp. JDS TaxID=2902797 RepID=UPI001E2EBE83|nr:T9SS type A sorting domain-containing protein [Epilithonimonas sp. JDS]MCD9855165.1 T9SS type A sorting domain-containing protein [Epilithonimonas sp. JDS]
MKKTILFTSISTVNILTAQIISKDQTFGTNGKFTITNSVNSVNDVYGSEMIQNQDGNIYFTSLMGDSTTGYTKTVLSKISSSGVVDTSFGVNGKAVVDSYLNPNSNLQRQPDGKLLIMGFHRGTGGDLKTYADIIRFLPDGQLDPTFGIGGTASFGNVSSDIDKRYYGLLQMGDKIIFYGEALSDNSYLQKRIVYRLNSDGTIDTSFGTGGTITTQGRFIFLDNFSNIVSFTSDTPSNGTIEKYNRNGEPMTTFGNNGSLTLTFDPGPIASAFLDSKNHLIYANMDGKMGRISPDGNLDTSFVFNSAMLPFPVLIFSIVEKDGYYYVGGMNQTNNEYFISKLESNGNMDSVFGYYVESDPDFHSIGCLIINEDNIVANGNGFITKYITSNDTSLSAVNSKSVVKIVFENPVEDYLIYSTNHALSYIDIYSVDGKLVKTLINGKNHVSTLPKGIYYIKATTENGITVTKKLIKK